MADTEERILDAALKVFASDGYAGATTRKIAQEANVAEMTLFRKFQSKENLLREVLKRNTETYFKQDSLLLLDKDADLDKSLQSLGHNISEAIKNKLEDNNQRMFSLMLLEEGRKRPEIAETLSSLARMFLKRLSEYFEIQIKNGKMRNVNPQTAALIFLSYFGYTSLLREITGDTVLGSSDNEIEDFINIFTKVSELSNVDMVN
jgi:TetR/AcrR family transcriptional regulator